MCTHCPRTLGAANVHACMYTQPRKSVLVRIKGRMHVAVLATCQGP